LFQQSASPHIISVESSSAESKPEASIQVQDRDVTRFLWLQDPTKTGLDNNLQIYRFCRVLFGIISSPFLLAAKINFHLQQSDLPVAKKVKENIYVDNVITGDDTLSDAKDLYTEAKSLFQQPL